MKRLSVFSILLIATIAIGILGCESAQDTSTESLGEITAPEMMLAYVDGSTATLSDLEGKVVLLNFWATWCPPCKQELPHFEALHQAYEGEGLAVVGVSMDQAGVDYVRTFSEEVGITYPIAMAPFEGMEKIWARNESIQTVHGFGDEAPALSNGSVQMMPTTFVIDRSGKIYRKHVGPRDRETLEPELRMLLGIREPLAEPS